MSDHESNADWKAMVDLQMYNVQEEQALMNVVPIIRQLKERYDGIDTSGLVSFLKDIDEMRVAREAVIQQYISATLGEDAAKELKSKAAYFAAEDSPERLSPPNTLPGGSSSDGSQLPRELFQESNQKKRSSDISLEGETEHQRKRARAATPEGEVAQLDQDEEHGEEQRRRQLEREEAEPEEMAIEEEQQRLAEERIEREKEVARVQQEKDAEEQRRLQREKEELERQEMAAKEQQRLADQQRLANERIEREKEVARVQQQEAEEQRRLQREKEELEQQEEAKVKVALHIQCCYRGLVARAKANELRLAAAKAEGAVTIQCLFRVSTARAKAKTLRVAAAKAKVAINMQLLFRIASGRSTRRATVKRVADIQRVWRGFMGRKEAMRLMEVKIRNIIEGLPDDLAQHHVVVVSLKLLKALMDKLQEALDPQSPNLLGIPMITHRLIVIIQTLAHYKKMMKGHVSQREAKSMDTFININVNQSIASISSTIESSIEAKTNAMNGQSPFTQPLLQLKAAMDRFNTGEATLGTKLKPSDVKEMKNFFTFDQATENVVVNCLHLSLIVFVEDYLTVERLYENQDGLERAIALWYQKNPGEELNVATMSVLEYRERALLPALVDERFREDAIEVDLDFANHLTDLRKTGRSDIVIDAFRVASVRKLDGSTDSECQVDYCTDTSEKISDLRRRMVCTYFNITASTTIQLYLGDDTLFPNGFISDLLMNSPTFCKRQCNFASRGTKNKKNPSKDKPGLFQEGHALADTVKGIRDKMKRYVMKEKPIIIDHADHIVSVKELFF